MNDSIDEEITPEVIASQVELERDGFFGTVVIVEGDSDASFYGQIFTPGACSFVVSCGKDNAIGAMQILQPAAGNDVICIVDADFHHLSVSSVPHTANTFVTDYHDSEVMMIESQSFEKLFKEFTTRTKSIKHATTMHKVKDIVYGAVSALGAFRFISARDCINLTFRHLKESDYGFISQAELKLDINHVVNSVKNKSKQYSLDNIEITDAINAVLESEYDRKQLCNGHDLCGAIARSLQRFFGSEDTKSASRTNVERILRIGYETRYFLNTSLCLAIDAWQKSSGRSIVSV